jgi:hypothetical protein
LMPLDYAPNLRSVMTGIGPAATSENENDRSYSNLGNLG